MKFYPSAKQAFMFISLCCLSAPAVAACSNDELRKYVKVDNILEDYKEVFVKARRAYEQATESESRADAVKYCQLERQMNNLSLEWLSLDRKLKQACPIFYAEWAIDGKEARDLFNNNQPRHQKVDDACVIDGYSNRQDL